MVVGRVAREAGALGRPSGRSERLERISIQSKPTRLQGWPAYRSGIVATCCCGGGCCGRRRAVTKLKKHTLLLPCKVREQSASCPALLHHPQKAHPQKALGRGVPVLKASSAEVWMGRAISRRQDRAMNMRATMATSLSSWWRLAGGCARKLVSADCRQSRLEQGS